ncbi:carboxypeptidase-like regulatory domain-containing protein [Capnocytophaga sp.]|uniref:carboxypeptidase-like regulatory domain-containing protein n=1 Tax=Capnocytophaga sp. TaxID=44737 RepID=UPI0026DC3417|nr:carboxypeptidase-like regulatory domain-containing protein [Capnocytophaga sp.]MDO5106500.1 carboxypeptidase-like regulatory domain-containing protein [Capnocytophaga sp.]
MRKFYLIIVFTIAVFQWAVAQNGYLRGRVLVNDSVPLPRVHIQNTTNGLQTTTNESGYFTIKAAVGHTLQLTYVGMKKMLRRVIKSDFDFAGVVLQMKEEITELEAVEVSKYQKVTAQELGVITHKPIERTFAEKRLYASKDGILGLVNVITGRTKMLKKVVENEENLFVVAYIQENTADFLEKELNLTDDEIQFLAYYVMEDAEIRALVKLKNTGNLQFTLLETWRKIQKELSENE